MTKKTCKRCLHDIDLKNQKYVLLGTYEKGKPLEESHYHYICFVEWYEGQVKLKADNLVKDIRERAIVIAKNLMQKMGGIQGV